MLHKLDKDSLEIICRFCHSDELIALCGTHQKFIETIEKLETLHMEHCSSSETSAMVGISVDHEQESTETDHSEQESNRHQPTTKSAFLKPSSGGKQDEKTKFRLQIYHPSYTVYITSSAASKNWFNDYGEYLEQELNFKRVADTEFSFVLEREIMKSDFVKLLKEKLKSNIEKVHDRGGEVTQGVKNIIDSEFKPFSSKNTQYLTKFYDRFTIRVVFMRQYFESRNFISMEQGFNIYQGNTGSLTGLDLKRNTDYSDRVIGIENLLTHNNSKSQVVCDAMLCMILQHTMPKYYYENYRVPEELEDFKKLALVDVFYNEMLNSVEKFEKTIPIFQTQNYFNTPFELFKHGLEMCFDLLYNQLSTRKRIELVEKLVITYLNQNLSEKDFAIVSSMSSLKDKDIKLGKYVSHSIGNDKSLCFIVVCLETTISMITRNEQTTKTEKVDLVEYTVTIPNLFNGNTINQVKIIRCYLRPKATSSDAQTFIPLPTKPFCGIL